MRLSAVALALLAALAGCATPGDTAPPIPTPASAAPSIECPDPCERAIDEGPLRSFEPNAAASADGAILAVASEQWVGIARTIIVHTSTDGGATWTMARLASDAPLAACGMYADPIVAILDDGTILAGGITYSSTIYALFVQDEVGAAWGDIFLQRSTDGGKTFGETRVLNNEDGIACKPRPDAPIFHFADKPFLAAAPGGKAYISWASREGPVFATSADSGDTWTQLPALGDVIDSAYSCSIAIAPDGTLFTAFGVFGDEQFLEGPYVGRLDDTTWTVHEVSKNGSAYPMVAVGPGPNGTRVFATYPEGPDREQMTPMLTWSDDRGETWAPPVALDVTEADGWTVPSLTVDAHGTAYSGFFHHLEDDTNEYRVTAVRNGTASPPVTVNKSPIGHQGLSLDLGHYMGIAPLPEGAFVAWVSGAAPATDLRGAVVTAR